MAAKRYFRRNQTKSTNRQTPLARHVEQTSHTTTGQALDRSATDAHDPEILDYINPFLQTWRDGLPLEPVDLSTQAGAQDALRVLDEKQSLIEQKLRVSRALRSLLEQRKYSS
ncbi:MAG: hypothetical protein KDD69_08380 [Bdellovibrionales bacterium]|nr:hypothetical protein [Bdellovibrionales bacterium]